MDNYNSKYNTELSGECWYDRHNPKAFGSLRSHVQSVLSAVLSHLIYMMVCTLDQSPLGCTDPERAHPLDRIVQNGPALRAGTGTWACIRPDLLLGSTKTALD